MNVAPITDEQRERIKGCTVVASVSGGKDSAAMSLWLHENGVEHQRVFMDTRWEHEWLYEYLRGPLTAAIGPITELSGPRGMVELCRWKQALPARLRRWCTGELKGKPVQEYLATIPNAINAVGIRAEESRDRAKFNEWEDAGDYAEVWRPLLRWTEADVIEIHQRHGLKPCRLYTDLGEPRVGCWPCIFATKLQIRSVANNTPERIDEIRTLEAELTTSAQARNPDAHPRTWFHSHVTGESVPIDEVVRWSRTAYGGRQPELFAANPADAGCARWGLCEGHVSAAWVENDNQP